MREYKLANIDHRLTVDLTEYEDLIKSIVKKEVPSVKVSVYEDKYVLNKRIGKGQAIRIGRKLAKSALGEYCILRPILFVGQDKTKTKNKGGKVNNGRSTTSSNAKLGGRPKKTPSGRHK